MTFAACEDDPILTPQESKGAAGGSYSRINPSAPSDSVRIGVDRREIRNPKTF
jgi:hypothetical protein